MALADVVRGDAPGFTEHESGLIVPNALKRRRVVLPKADWKILDRAVKVFVHLGVTVGFQCKNERCEDRNVVRATQVDGTPVMRCGCTDRVLSRNV